MRANHSNKHIRDAIRYAESKDWSAAKASPQVHMGDTMVSTTHPRMLLHSSHVDAAKS